ncbi:hypothetical protein GUJ93_ZPchr0010g8075 [Zizania palustris]|uniref:Uncharacterized protein n=1 Tax=Zizania palustris TaxID=103762 RepID=A0A8J5SZ90_ZIZPA|nr:hypothetical protein GUJ93_ZPchr0010g8075 [Zizania palustris]
MACVQSRGLHRLAFFTNAPPRTRKAAAAAVACAAKHLKNSVVRSLALHPALPATRAAPRCLGSRAATEPRALRLLLS